MSNFFVFPFNQNHKTRFKKNWKQISKISKVFEFQTCSGVARYFKDKLFKVVNETKLTVTSFDKSFNNVISKGQMDILVRFLNSAKNSVSTPYVNSVFMRKATVTDVLENLEVASKGLNKNKFIQVSSGPNVNLKFLELLAGKPKYDSLNELISICTRTFDTVIRAFQNAENSTIWNIKNYYV